MISPQRQKEINIRGSPTYRYIHAGTLITNDFFIVDLETENSQITGCSKYYPMDFLQIQNNSDEKLEIEAGASVELVESKTIKTLDRDKDGLGYRTVKITNLSATTTSASEISLIMKRLPLNQDEIERRKLENPNPIKKLLNIPLFK